MSALVSSEIFTLLFNTLPPDDKYSRRFILIFWQQLQTSLTQKLMAFFRFFIAFRNVHEI